MESQVAEKDKPAISDENLYASTLILPGQAWFNRNYLKIQATMVIGKFLTGFVLIFAALGKYFGYFHFVVFETGDPVTEVMHHRASVAIMFMVGLNCLMSTLPPAKQVDSSKIYAGKEEYKAKAD